MFTIGKSNLSYVVASILFIGFLSWSYISIPTFFQNSYDLQRFWYIGTIILLTLIFLPILYVRLSSLKYSKKVNISINIIFVVLITCISMGLAKLFILFFALIERKTETLEGKIGSVGLHSFFAPNLLKIVMLVIFFSLSYLGFQNLIIGALGGGGSGLSQIQEIILNIFNYMFFYPVLSLNVGLPLSFGFLFEYFLISYFWSCLLDYIFSKLKFS